MIAQDAHSESTTQSAEETRARVNATLHCSGSSPRGKSTALACPSETAEGHSLDEVLTCEDDANVGNKVIPQ